MPGCRLCATLCSLNNGHYRKLHFLRPRLCCHCLCTNSQQCHTYIRYIYIYINPNMLIMLTYIYTSHVFLQACQSLSYGHTYVAVAPVHMDAWRPCSSCMHVHMLRCIQVHLCVITTIERSMVITTCSVRFLSLKAKARLTFGFTYLAIACCLFLAHICAYMVLASSDGFLVFGVHKHPSQNLLAA